jgi:putative glutamine amidotransferase
MQRSDKQLQIVVLSAGEDNLAELESCSGVIFTGGVDVHPQFYDAESWDYPNKPADWNIKRDKFEIEVFHQAFAMKMPILGICRGLQLINCILGGNLIQDLDKHNIYWHKSESGNDRYHQVFINYSTPVFPMIDYQILETNSAHHQAADRIGKNLKEFATSSEQVTEGLFMPDHLYPYLYLVQWHPERIPDGKINPASKRLAESFLEAANAFKNL